MNKPTVKARAALREYKELASAWEAHVLAAVAAEDVSVFLTHERYAHVLVDAMWRCLQKIWGATYEQRENLTSNEQSSRIGKILSSLYANAEEAASVDNGQEGA